MKMTIWYNLQVQSKVDISPGVNYVIAIVNASTNTNKQNKHEKIHLTHHFPSSASPMTSYVGGGGHCQSKRKKRKKKKKKDHNRKIPLSVIEKKTKDTGAKQRPSIRQRLTISQKKIK